MTCASAPGKIILFGEHAVVYHHPAVAVPITQVQADVVIDNAVRSQRESPTLVGQPLSNIWIDAPDISYHNIISQLPTGSALRCTIEAVLRALQIDNPPQIKIKITSSIPLASGLGSGAAVSVALIRALSAHLDHPFNDAQVNELCYEIEKIHHGTPSGIDNTVITYARPVYFIKDQPIETLRVNTAFTILIADTGIRAPTKESVGDVRKLWLANPTYWEDVFDQVGGIARQARQAIESGNWRKLGPLMDANHALLQEMTVSSPELDRLVQVAKAAGAEGAKLSGGGRGGNMIALIAPENANDVATALQQVGARTIITTIQ